MRTVFLSYIGHRENVLLGHHRTTWSGSRNNEQLSAVARDDMEMIASNHLAAGPLFPFNGRRGFTANVITDPIDSLDFIDDPR